jgi:hypothetical protein
MFRTAPYLCLGRSKRFIPSLQRPDLRWGPPSLLFNGYRRVLSPRLKRPGREADNSPPSALRPRMSGAITLFLLLLPSVHILLNSRFPRHSLLCKCLHGAEPLFKICNKPLTWQWNCRPQHTVLLLLLIVFPSQQWSFHRHTVHENFQSLLPSVF